MSEEPESDLSSRIRKLKEELSEIQLPELRDDEVDAKKRQLSSSGSTELPPVPDWNPPINPFKAKALEEKRDNDAMKGLGLGLSVAYVLMGLPLLGIGIGHLYDMTQKAGTNGKALGCIVGMCLGLWMAVKTLNKVQTR